MAKKKPGGKSGGNGVRIVAGFRHYITGEYIRAADKGVRGFPIGSNHKRKPKG